MAMYEVTYTVETLEGSTKTFKRVFHDSDMAESEVNFQPGKVLTTGDKIVAAKMKKVKNIS